MSRDTVRVIAQALAADLIAPTQTDAGPAELTFVEEWQDGKVLNAHLATAHVQSALSRCPDLLVGEIDLRRFMLVGSARKRS